MIFIDQTLLLFFAQMGSIFLQNFFAVFSLSVQAVARLKPSISEFVSELSTTVPQLQPVWLKSCDLYRPNNVAIFLHEGDQL